jgi:allantoicase
MVGRPGAVAPRATKIGLFSSCMYFTSTKVFVFELYFRGTPGHLERVEIDTKHFLGNFPESCQIHAIYTPADFDWSIATPDDSLWTLILPRTKLGPDRQHYFEFENVENRVYTHVKVTIYPDGGLKRVRIIGCKAYSVGRN